MCNRWLIILGILWTFSAKAQQQKPVRDTSFTIHSTFVKERKYRPYITLAQVHENKSVIVKADLVYDVIGERKLFLDAFYPQKKGKYPGVVLIHGGGWQSGDKAHMHTIAKYLASQGYVAFAVEYRLSPEAKYPQAVYDLKSSIKWMRENARKFNLDTRNIASLGTSAGGQLAALLGVTNENNKFEDAKRGNRKFSSNVQAVINIDGTLAFRHPESSEGKAASNWLGGTYEENPKHWEEAAPLNHVSQKSVPILFLNSSIPRFHAGRDDMIRKLNIYGIYSEVHEFPDTPHTFWFFNPWFQPMMDYTVDFLNKTFKP
ncbi:alpha/beta hydrolase [Pseudoxanthomonas sp. SGD-10]|nr:alpha/beta hydrolase [Pseudoxanthomonas sp. SGD-10]